MLSVNTFLEVNWSMQQRKYTGKVHEEVYSVFWVGPLLQAACEPHAVRGKENTFLPSYKWQCSWGARRVSYTLNIPYLLLWTEVSKNTEFFIVFKYICIGYAKIWHFYPKLVLKSRGLQKLKSCTVIYHINFVNKLWEDLMMHTFLQIHHFVWRGY